LCLNARRFKETFQLPNPRRMPHFAQRFCLDLADPLPSDLELAAYFFQRSTVAVNEAKSLLEDLSFSVSEGFKDILDLLLQQDNRSHVARVFGATILDEVAEVGFLALAYR